MRAAGLGGEGPSKSGRVSLHRLKGKGLLGGSQVSCHRWVADPRARQVLGEGGGSGARLEQEKSAHDLVDHSLAAVSGADADGLGSR